MVVVGAVNWGLYPFGFNLVEMFLGAIPLAAKGAYILVGLAGVYHIYDAFQR